MSSYNQSTRDETERGDRDLEAERWFKRHIQAYPV
jgi:hypothetical protein